MCFAGRGCLLLFGFPLSKEFFYLFCSHLPISAIPRAWLGLWWFLLVVSFFLRVPGKLWRGSFEPACSSQLRVGVLGRVSNMWYRYLENCTDSFGDFHSHSPSIDHWTLLHFLCRFEAILIVLFGTFLSFLCLLLFFDSKLFWLFCLKPFYFFVFAFIF